MSRSVFGVTAAVMLSMLPAAPPALAVPFSVKPAVITSNSGGFTSNSGGFLTEVSHSLNKCRKGRDWRCNQNYRHHHNLHHHGHHHWRHHHRRHHGGVCIRIEGFSICF